MFLYVMIILINLITIAPQNISNNNKIYLAKNCMQLLICSSRIELRNFNVVNNQYTKWFNQGAYLSRKLATLKAWNCPQFDKVCSNR